jgi:hypothetical protein
LDWCRLRQPNQGIGCRALRPVGIDPAAVSVLWPRRKRHLVGRRGHQRAPGAVSVFAHAGGLTNTWRGGRSPQANIRPSGSRPVGAGQWEQPSGSRLAETGRVGAGRWGQGRPVKSAAPLGSSGPGGNVPKLRARRAGTGQSTRRALPRHHTFMVSGHWGETWASGAARVDEGGHGALWVAAEWVFV